MFQSTQTFQFSDETAKMKILTRLVKEGAITLEEAFILSERETKVPAPSITWPKGQEVWPPIKPENPYKPLRPYQPLRTNDPDWIYRQPDITCTYTAIN